MKTGIQPQDSVLSSLTHPEFPTQNVDRHLQFENPESRPVALVIENSAPVRGLICGRLFDDGFHAIGTGSADLAYKAISLLDGHIDLLIAACQMPGMCSERLAAWLLRRQPTAKVILLGAPTEPTTELAGVTILKKPFTLAELSTAVKQCGTFSALKYKPSA